MRKMKDSGIEWIGDIPKDWSITKIKFLLSNENDSLKVGPFGSQLSGTDFVAEGYWVYSQRVVLDKNFEHNSMLVTKEKFDAMSAFRVRENDILITTRGTIGKICRVPKKFSEGILHPCIIKFRIDEQKYCYKLLELIFNHSGILQKQLNYLSNATTIEVIYSGTYKNLQIPFPPLDEQKKIADFLDEKCGEIDSIRSDIQKQIDILSDYKKSVITEAVTKGLNPKAKLKDSGIEWIGKIPEHWNIKRLKYTATIVRGGSPRPIESFISDNDIGFNWVKIGDTEKGCKYITRTSCKIIPSGLSKTRMVHKNDLILTNSMSFGSPYIMGIDGCIHDGWVAFSNYKGVEKEFLYWCLSSNLCKTQFEKQVDGGVVQNLNIDKIGMTTIFLPPIEEQLTIVSHLNERCSAIDATIADKQKQHETLDEYKKSLIFEYVTGKKEVPA